MLFGQRVAVQYRFEAAETMLEGIDLRTELSNLRSEVVIVGHTAAIELNRQKDIDIRWFRSSRPKRAQHGEPCREAYVTWAVWHIPMMVAGLCDFAAF
jgi:hypothetical protein